MLAWRIVAAEPDIDEFADGGVRRDILKAAFAQDRRLQRELRRQAHAHLLARRRLSGLVVEYGIGTVVAALYPVCAGGENKSPRIVERNSYLSPDLGADIGDIAAPRPFPLRKPRGDTLKA